ncbi:hypothetical protein [Bosea sp. 685]|uniref:hypothetical protein n=1 Tax=Bosea sp. 685 TaxID=3080057 RepID=UPI002892B6B2|nr:hypothetical protein [Bosea sp. 685]WNJ91113.1 hypothetical protein RMR04_02055 [Bosea sp. 685]
MVSNVQNAFRVPSANDRTIISLFDELMQEHGFNPCSIHLRGAPRGYTRTDNQSLFEQLTKKKLHTLRIVSSHGPIVAVTYTRGIFVPNPHGHGLQHIHSPSWDTIEVSPASQEANDPIAVATIIELINKRLPMPMGGTDDLGPAEAAVASHVAMVERLEQTLTDMAERHGAQQAKLQEEFDQRRQKLIEETDALRATTVADLDGERQSVAVQRQELDERAKELDDRQNTHVRRDIRRELKVQLAEYKTAFGLTAGTKGLRTPIHWAVAVVLVVVIAGVVLFASQTPPNDGWPYALFLAKPLGLTFVGVVIATWYINWMNRWFERHADVEFRLKELELDIDRASWVVETAFEWKKAGEDAMPDKMLEAIGRNLFAGREETPAAGLNPVDQLASALLGQASHAKINLAGHQIEFDRKALKRAGKAE